jgi:hypothetical protein
MTRKTGQIIRRGPQMWIVRIYIGRDLETGRRKYIGKSAQGRLRVAQTHLNRMLAERDLGRNIRSSRQTLGQYLDHWLEICACLRLWAKSFRDYSTLLARHGTSVHYWTEDNSGSFHRRRFRRSTASCSTGSCRPARFAIRTPAFSRRYGKRYVGSSCHRIRRRISICRANRRDVPLYSMSNRLSNSSR